MWRDITGTCPLHNTDITIQVEYIEVKVLNCHLPQYKAGSFRCNKSADLSSYCSRCPIFYAPSTQRLS